MIGRRAARRPVVALAAIIVAILSPASPAAADPARPGDVWSRVVSIAPADAPVRAEVVGGDAFIRLVVERGHEAVVYDYGTPREPYLRFRADGVVEENVSSPAYALNRSRYGVPAATEAPVTDGGSEPAWHRVANGGVYAWHDHRIHFMARSRPDVTPWQLDLTVDGGPVVVHGFWGPATAPSPLPWLVLAAGIATLVAFAAWLARPLAALGVIVAALAALRVAVALGQLPAAGGVVRTGGLAVVAVAAAAVSIALARRPASAALLGGAGIALALWALRRLSTLHHAILITSLPSWFERATTAVALGAGVAAAVAGVRDAIAPPKAARQVSPTARSGARAATAGENP